MGVGAPVFSQFPQKFELLLVFLVFFTSFINHTVGTAFFFF